MCLKCGEEKKINTDVTRESALKEIIRLKADTSGQRGLILCFFQYVIL